MNKKTFVLVTLLGVLGLACPVWCQGTTPNIDPAAQELLQKVAQFYQGMNSFHYTTLGTVSIQSQTLSKDMSTKTQVWMQRPNLVQVKVQQGVKSLETISDGSKVFFFVPALNAFLTRPTPATLEELVLTHIAKQNSPVEDGRFGFFYMTSDPYASMITGASRVEMLGAENVEGVECQHLRFQRRPYNVDVWFQAGDQPLLRKIAPDAAPLEANLSKKLPGVKIDMHVVYNDWQVNPALPPETFKFVPPAGAEEKTSFADMTRNKDPKDLIGKDAPELRVPLLAGGEFNLAEHKGKNVVIVDFWATWCGPCVYGLPIVSSVADEYKDKGVVFVAVNEGDDAQVIQSFMEKKQFSFPVGLDPTGERAMNFYVSGIPQTVIVGKDGKVATVHVGLALDIKAILKQEIDTLLSGGSLPAPAVVAPANGAAPAGGPQGATAPAPPASQPPR